MRELLCHREHAPPDDDLRRYAVELGVEAR